jgi:4-hydroxy-tetrahydrodipicolinate synthase
MGEMIAAFGKGDVERARELNARMLPSFAYETSDAAPNPLPTKAMLEVLGRPVGQARLPMGLPPEGLADAARAVAADLGLL